MILSEKNTKNHKLQRIWASFVHKCVHIPDVALTDMRALRAYLLRMRVKHHFSYQSTVHTYNTRVLDIEKSFGLRGKMRKFRLARSLRSLVIIYEISQISDLFF